MHEFRPIAPVERDEFDRIRRYAFHLEDGPLPREDGADSDGKSPLGTRYGYVDDGALASICIHYTFETRLRGEWIDMGGLGAVATPPERRREGNVRWMLQESIRTFEGVPLVALWPFSTAFYRQFGWASANEIARHTVPPAELPTGFGQAGEFRPVEPDDWRTLRTVHLAAARGETLSMRRGEQWWRRRIFHAWGDDRRHVYVYSRGDTPAGYVVYDVGEDDERELTVEYLGARDQEAYRAVLSFLGDHDSQVDRVTLDRPGSGTLFDIIDAPQEVNAQLRPGPMVRLTDVTRALEAVPYPDGVDEQLTLEVDDPLLAENTDTYRLLVEDGEGICRSKSDASPEVTLDVGALSRLLIGARSVDALATVGALSADADGRETLNRLFPPERVFLREFF